MASTTHRYGFSDRITGEAHLQLSRAVQMGSVAATATMFDAALVGGSASVSRSGRGTGYRLEASFERRASGLSFGLRSEFAARWGGGACRFAASVPAADDPQPLLAGLVCRPEILPAAR